MNEVDPKPLTKLQKAVNLFGGKMKDPKLLKTNMFQLYVSAEWFYNKKDYLIFATFLTIQTINLIFMVANLYLYIDNLGAVVENLSYTTVVLSALYVNVCMVLKANDFNTMVEDLIKITKRFDMEKNCYDTEKIARAISNAGFIYAFVGSVLYTITPAIANKSSCSKTGAVACGLPMTGSFPFSVQKTPNHQIMYIFQSVSIFIMAFTLLVPSLFLTGVILHIGTHLKAICDKLNTICQQPIEVRLYLLREVVKHHTAILSFSQRATRLFSIITLTKSSLASIVISVLGFQLLLMFKDTTTETNLNANVFRYALHMMGWLLAIFLVSSMGQKLAEDSTRVAVVAYGIPWYDQTVFLQKNIFFIILRSQKPLNLTIVSVTTISLKTFANVMRSAYSFFALLYNALE